MGFIWSNLWAQSQLRLTLLQHHQRHLCYTQCYKFRQKPWKNSCWTVEKLASLTTQILTFPLTFLFSYCYTVLPSVALQIHPPRCRLTHSFNAQFFCALGGKKRRFSDFWKVGEGLLGPVGRGSVVPMVDVLVLVVDRHWHIIKL